MTLHYLATPYSRYPDGITAAFEDAARLTARLIRVGYVVYSPIAHGHPIAMLGGLNPLNNDFWLEYDAHMMRLADSLLVAQMASWRESRGIAQEIEFFENAGKPVHYLDCLTLTFERVPTSQMLIDVAHRVTA